MNRFHKLASECQTDAARYATLAWNAMIDYGNTDCVRDRRALLRDFEFYSARAAHWHRMAVRNRNTGDHEVRIEAGHQAAHEAA